MGTSEFALPALDAIFRRFGRGLLCVYTAPARLGESKRVVNLPPVYLYSEENNIPIRTPKTLTDEVKIIIEFAPDIIVVASYGMILRKDILEIPRYGCINIHPSDLPRWRGAAPIERSIMACDKKGAVCIMQMDEGCDTGGIIAKRSIDIPEDILGWQLRGYTAQLGADMLIEVLENIENISVKAQSESGYCYAHKLTKEDEIIDWGADTAKFIHAKIRALTPSPGAYFVYNAERIKILEAKYTDGPSSPGEVLEIGKGKISIGCKEGLIIPEVMQRQGRKAMRAEELLSGMRIPAGTKIN